MTPDRSRYGNSYTDEELRDFAWSGHSRVRDEVLERLFTPEEIVEIKKIRKARVEEENARKDAAEEEERKQLEQEAALKLELKTPYHEYHFKHPLPVCYFAMECNFTIGKNMTKR